ncbi:MAG: iron-containing alcohol dehydrogenase [Anaerolineaceae bacterium]|nr:iron-containing alcohol dehydrogenase [Anaerolineaceae bacterium]
MLNTTCNFIFHFPTRIEYGLNKFSNLSEYVKGLGNKALIVSYKDKSLSSYISECQKMLEKGGIKSVLFEEVETNPTHQIINQGTEFAIREQCDMVIGLGGGSAIDVAKTIAVASVEKVDIWDIVEGKKLSNKPLPMIAIPTTSGTGSEVTQYAVISNNEKKRKEGIGKKEFYPTISIVDPMLTAGMPSKLTAAVGLDALTHAIEGYTTKFTNPMTDALAEMAIQLAGKSLRKAVYEGNDINARSDMMMSSMLAGMVITHTDTSLAHVIGEAMGAVFNVHHGLGVALTLPAVMEYNCFSNVVKFARIAELLGESIKGLSKRDAAKLASSAVRKMIFDLEVPRGLAALGAKEDDYVLDLCCRPGWDAANLRPASRDDFTKLIKGSLSPEMSYWKYQSY